MIISNEEERRNPGGLIAENGAPIKMNGNYDIGHHPLIYFVDSDPVFREELGQQISHYGYQVRTFEHIDHAKKAAAQEYPAALIVDMEFPAGETAMTVAEILEMQESLPLIFLSDLSDFEYRLQAVRFGGKAYFTKPLEIGSLIGVLDVHTARVMTDPYSVLIVEHDPALAADSAAVLESAGMLTKAIHDPLQIMAAMEDFEPELVLMNLYYPKCLGMELATMIRQKESYNSIPIVFLARETNPDRRLAALQKGADDFLSIPADPEHLIASVTVRVERSRTLRSLMATDHLTGLLNHTALMDKLDQGITRAKRRGELMSFGMLDLDKFKTVNDAHGHATGDRVIKNLARLLKQRLRRTDYVGRYGGEELAVVLMDTSGEVALKVLDSIRGGFATIPQRSHRGDFFVTFSCGVASFPEFQDSMEICQAADKSLYAAKEGGRNRVMLAQGSD